MWGGALKKDDPRRFTSGMISAFGMSAYHEKPVMFGGYAQDRLDLGDVVLEGGLRIHHFDSKALFPFTPGRITTDTFVMDPLNPTAHFIKPPAHTASTPTLPVSFPRTYSSNF